ncbi:hypothetical protein CW713_04305 [Methanophagales archaeon]|nr:MAG: hypothetical protein CW713_04305 [Methanophagales archaeon]
MKPIIAVSRKAIFTLSIYIVTYTTTKEGFSELYFEEHEELPKIINAGEEPQFAFTIASHELNVTSYEYTVSLDDEIVEEGGFILGPGENITANVSFIPENSSLTFIRNLTTTESSHLIFSRPSTITSGSKNVESDGRVLMPVKFPIAGDKNNTIFLKIDPNSSEEYTFRYSAKEPVTETLICFDTSKSEKTPNCIEARYISQIGINLSDYNILRNISIFPQTGFDFINSTTIISSNYGDIRVSYEKNISEYRYEYKKVSVEVTSEDGTEYEIHYWTIVV